MKIFLAGNSGGLVYREKLAIKHMARRLMSYVYHNDKGKYRNEFYEWKKEKDNKIK